MDCFDKRVVTIFREICMKRILGLGIVVGSFFSLYGSHKSISPGGCSKSSAVVLMEHLERHCQKGNVEGVEDILGRVTWLDVNRHSQVPLLIATLAGSGSSENKSALIQTLRKRGVKGERLYKGMFPLHWAVMSGCDATVIEELCNGLCNPNSMTRYGVSPLTLALLKHWLSPEEEKVSETVFNVLLKYKAQFKSSEPSVSWQMLAGLERNSHGWIEVMGAYLCHLDIFQKMQQEIAKEIHAA
jgi:hypothetical protein